VINETKEELLSPFYYYQDKLKTKRNEQTLLKREREKEKTN